MLYPIELLGRTRRAQHVSEPARICHARGERHPRPALGKTEPSRAVSSRNITMQNARITLAKHAKRNYKFQTHKTKLLKSKGFLD